MHDNIYNILDSLVRQCLSGPSLGNYRYLSSFWVKSEICTLSAPGLFVICVSCFSFTFIPLLDVLIYFIVQHFVLGETTP